MTTQAHIGIDLGGTHLRAALVSMTGEVLYRHSRTSSRQLSITTLIDTLQELVGLLVAQAADAELQLGGVGVGVPALLDHRGVIVTAPNIPGLNGADLGTRLAEVVGLPVSVCNDADAAALGEARFGAGADLTSFLMLTLGTGVGGALILSGNLWRGCDGVAGEVGHVTVEPFGRKCGCGSHGCLEQYASATGIVLTARELLAQEASSLLNQIDAHGLTSAAVAEAAIQGDNVACAAYAEAGRKLGQMLGGVAVNLLNLEGVVVGGGVAPSLDLMRPSLERELYRRAFDVAAHRFKIRLAQLGDDAGLVGAAHYAGGDDDG
ncbi:MAG: ROK family protein [Desulfuromonas sp.]|nr:MAG: ROK family protein [Desulfuromonas sp.]